MGQISFVPYNSKLLYKVLNQLELIAKERDKTISQVALNWLLTRPSVSNIVLGARNEEQLKQNFGAVDWSLSPSEIARLDEVSATPAPYLYWHQAGFAELTRR